MVKNGLFSLIKDPLVSLTRFLDSYVETGCKLAARRFSSIYLLASSSDSLNHNICQQFGWSQPQYFYVETGCKVAVRKKTLGNLLSTRQSAGFR
jgi:hypothetical protein